MRYILHYLTTADPSFCEMIPHKNKTTNGKYTFLQYSLSTCFADEHTETPPKSIQFDSCSRFLNNELNSFDFCVVLSPGNLTRDTRIHMREQAIFFAYFWQMLCKELYPVDEWMICRFINARHFIESQRHTWANYFFFIWTLCSAKRNAFSTMLSNQKRGQ